MSNHGENRSGNGGTKANNRQSKRPTPLRTSKDEVRQIRQPVIIHTYSPKIIKVDPKEFSDMVQRLTGNVSSLKRKPEHSPRLFDDSSEKGTSLLPSPTSSGDSVQQGNHNILLGHHGFPSPRGPLLAFETGFPHHQTMESAFPAFSVADPSYANAAMSIPSYTTLLGSAGAYSPIPSPNLLNHAFLQELPALSPQGFDPFTMPFSLSPTYGRFPTGMLFPPTASAVGAQGCCPDV